MTASSLPTIGIVGLSHLGIVASAGFASLGFRIVGVDTDAAAVQKLGQGDCLVPEPGLADLFARHKDAMTFTTDFSRLRACDIVFIAKDTPTDEEKNEMRIEHVQALIETSIPHLQDGVAFVVMAQVPVGFTRNIRQRIGQLRPVLPFSLSYFVETLIIGDAVARFVRPERVIIGREDAAQPLNNSLQTLLSRFTCPILFMGLESAELTKAAINLYLATTVTYANTLANICEAVGADMSEVIPALRLDKRIGPAAYIKPGLGLSGGHLERDIVMLSRLAETHKARAELLDVIQRESAARYAWLCDALEREVFAKRTTTNKPTIAIWGLSYKKNTDSTFRAPSMRVLHDFSARAKIVGYDPMAKLAHGAPLLRVANKYKALDDADCLLMLCDWDEFREVDFARLVSAMKTPLVIDGLGVWYDMKVPAGVQCIAMGKPIV